MPTANTGAPFPIGGGNPDLLITEVNSTWGRVGSGIGPINFWSRFGSLIYRDSAAGPGYAVPVNADSGGSNIARLRFPNAVYKLLAAVGIGRHDYKGDMEARSFEQIAGKILLKPLRAERIDGPCVPFDCVSPTSDPEGEIERSVNEIFAAWAEFLPLLQWIRLLVNGRLDAKHPLLIPYTQDTDMGGAGGGMFATDHLVNPLQKGSATFRNLIQLVKPFDEAGWALIKDTVQRIPDLDTLSLPNAFSMSPPLIMLASENAWRRWARVLGGPNLQLPLLMNNDTQQAALNSIYVGGAELMVNPYLYQLATDQTAIEKTAFLFPRGGQQRAPFIFREEVAPLLRRTGKDGALAHSNNMEQLYIQARNAWGYGEPRSVFKILEP